MKPKPFLLSRTCFVCNFSPFPDEDTPYRERILLQTYMPSMYNATLVYRYNIHISFSRISAWWLHCRKCILMAQTAPGRFLLLCSRNNNNEKIFDCVTCIVMCDLLFHMNTDKKPIFCTQSILLARFTISFIFVRILCPQSFAIKLSPKGLKNYILVLVACNSRSSLTLSMWLAGKQAGRRGKPNE